MRPFKKRELPAGGNPRGATARARKATTAVEAPAENARAKRLAHRAALLAVDKKATDVVVLDVRGKSSYTDYVVIASGESERQVAAMAENVEEALSAEGFNTLGTEGFRPGHWVLLDYGEVVVHLFYSEARAFYDLEGLWADTARETFS